MTVQIFLYICSWGPVVEEKTFKRYAEAVPFREGMLRCQRLAADDIWSSMFEQLVSANGVACRQMDQRPTS